MNHLLHVNGLKTTLQSAGNTITAVDDISFSINKGETFCLVGESGSGKSITALSIMRLLPECISDNPAGEIVFNFQHHTETGELDVLALDENALCAIRGSRIAMIFQEPMTSLNPIYSVGDQITEALLLHHNKLDETEAKSRALQAMRDVQIDDAETRFHDFPHQLSGGQRQRIMIAMALVCEPELLIADEPTTALDVTVQAEILRLIKALQQKNGMSVLFITHDFGVVAQIADTVGIMQHGKLVEIGRAQQVLQQPQHAYSKKLLAAVPENLARDEKTAQQVSDIPVIEVNQLQVFFPIQKGVIQRTVAHIKAVDNVDLCIHKGKIVALVGESGSGKTTLGRAILQLQQATAGSVKMHGTELTTLSNNALQPWRRHMQIVFQDPQSSLNPRLLIVNTLTEPMKAHKIGDDDEHRIELAAELMQSVQLSREHLWRYPHAFSGGQRQRIGIARALALNPEFIVCDEITSALDVSVQAEVLQLLQTIRKQRELTLLFITHNISVVEYLSDETIVMKGGKIVERGITKQVCGNPQHVYTQKLLAAVPRLHA